VRPASAGRHGSVSAKGTSDPRRPEFVRYPVQTIVHLELHFGCESISRREHVLHIDICVSREFACCVEIRFMARRREATGKRIERRRVPLVTCLSCECAQARGAVLKLLNHELLRSLRPV
jgi:hypothetical protein